MIIQTLQEILSSLMENEGGTRPLEAQFQLIKDGELEIRSATVVRLTLSGAILEIDKTLHRGQTVCLYIRVPKSLLTSLPGNQSNEKNEEALLETTVKVLSINENKGGTGNYSTQVQFHGNYRITSGES